MGIDNPRVKQIPVPRGLRCVLVHPHMYLGTREARAILNINVSRSDYVWQSANLAGFISGCYSNDLEMIRESFNDVIIEPQRHSLIPGFKDVQRAAMSAGALGCSISGAGPAVFAWSAIQHAEAVRGAMVAAFAAHHLAVGLLGLSHAELRRPRGKGLMAELRFVSSGGAAPARELESSHCTGTGPRRRSVLPTRMPLVDAGAFAPQSSLPRAWRARRSPSSSRATTCTSELAEPSPRRR